MPAPRRPGVMKEAAGMQGNGNQRARPLPPVTTRWAGPDGTHSRSATAIAPPFVPTREHVRTAAPPPVVPMFDSAPLHEQVADVEAMPWEDSSADVFPVADDRDVMHPHEAGPAVTSESDADDVRDLADWENSVEGDGGQAMPAWGDEDDAEAAAFAPPPRLNEEGVVIGRRAGEEAAPESTAGDDDVFPLDAFIIPPDSKRLPRGLEHAEDVQHEIAESLALRLEGIAARLRAEGFTGLLHLEEGQEPIDTLLAGVLAGYLAHRSQVLDHSDHGDHGAGAARGPATE